MSEGVIIQDTAGRIEECNVSAERILGLTADQMAGRTSLDLRWAAVHENGSAFPGEMHPAMVTLATGKPQSNVIMGVHKPDASLTWVSINSRLIRNRDATVSGVLSTFTDITERKRLEDSLEPMRSLFEHTTHAAVYGSMIFENGEPVDFVHHSVNPAFGRLTGIENAVGKRVCELVPGIRESNPELFEVYGRVASGGSPEKFESYVKSLGLWIAISVHSPRAGEFLATFEDITERKRNDEAIQRAHRAITEAERHYRSLFNGVSDAIFVFEMEPDGLSSPILDVNDIACTELGYTRTELLGMRLGDISAPEFHDDAPRIVERLLATPRVIREGALVAKDGQRIPVEIHTRPMSSGLRRTMISSVRNISERKRAEAVRAQLEAQLHDANKLEGVGKLAGGVAHEFNNLLTVINGYSGFLLHARELPEPVRAQVDAIHKAGERAALLTSQLLGFGRKQMIRPRRLYLNAMVRETLPQLGCLPGGTIRLETRLDPGSGNVHADPDQLRQILTNLADNAREAMPDGGTLEIRTCDIDLREGDRVVAAGARPGPYVLLSMSDTGCGMDEETRRQVFEPFFTTKGAGKGTGLGLSMVYGVVRQNGGWIEMTSQPGAGSTLTIYLPRMGGAVRPVEQTAGAVARVGEHSILLVEHQESVRAFAKEVLEQAGYRVLEAARSEEAIALAVEHAGALHLLVVDAMLPGMKGTELGRQVLRLGRGIKVLVISGYPAELIADQGEPLLEGMFLKKPFSPAQLLDKVRTLLEEQASDSSIAAD